MADMFPNAYTKLEELAIRLAAHDLAVDPEHVLAEGWGEGGWNESKWRSLARQLEIAHEVFNSERE